MKFDKKMIWYSLPILAGGYLIYRELSKKRPKDAPLPPVVINPIDTNVSDFPLKKGSRNSSVGSLQTLLNTALSCQSKTLLEVDNIFGSKTETALKDLTGKLTVSNSADFEKIKTQLSSVCGVSSNLDWAWKLIEAQKTGMYRFLNVRNPVSIYMVKKDFLGKWVSAVPYKELKLPARDNYSLDDYVLVSALNDGRLRIQITRGDLAGMYITKSVNDTKSFSIS